MIKNTFWQGDHFFGCSLTAAIEEFSKFDYLLAEFRLNNAIFVNLIKFPELTPKNASIAYEEGYKSIKNRKELFKYNHDVEILHELNNDEKIVFINNLFKKYKNMYELKLVIRMSEFWVSEFEIGYYDKILEKGLIKKRACRLIGTKLLVKNSKLLQMKI